MTICAIAIASLSLASLSPASPGTPGELQPLPLPAELSASTLSLGVRLDGVPVELRLERDSVRSPGFQVIVIDETGVAMEYPTPPSATWTGEVVGQPGSTVSASIVDGKVTGQIVGAEAGRAWSIEPADGEGPSAHRICAVQGGQIAGGAMTRVLPPDAEPWSSGGTLSLGTGNRKVVELGVDADGEFFQRLGSDVVATVLDMERMVHGVSAALERDTDVMLEINIAVVRLAPGPPYVATDRDGALQEFRLHWWTNFVGVNRDAAILFTDRSLTPGDARQCLQRVRVQRLRLRIRGAVSVTLCLCADVHGGFCRRHSPGSLSVH